MLVRALKLQMTEGTKLRGALAALVTRLPLLGGDWGNFRGLGGRTAADLLGF